MQDGILHGIDNDDADIINLQIKEPRVQTRLCLAVQDLTAFIRTPVKFKNRPKTLIFSGIHYF